MNFIFLGTGASCGVPAFYCGCKACQEALANSFYRRSRSAVLVSGRENLLIDAPTDLANQLIREDIHDIDYLALTHWHNDHVGGLGDLELYIRLRGKKPLQAFMTAETWTHLQTGFNSISELLDVHIIRPDDTVKAGGIQWTALAASHCEGTLGFLIKCGNNKIAYLPDTGIPSAATCEHLQGIEYLVLDATFWGKNWYPGEHLSFDEAVNLGQSLKVKQLYLTHISMHYDIPVTNIELEEIIQPYKGQVRLAYDGLKLVLS